MNINQLHDFSKLLSVKTLFKNENGMVSSIKILKDGILDKHTSMVPTVLICIKGNVIFQDERGAEEDMKAGDFVLIEPDVVHWMKGLRRSDLVLFQ